MSQDGKMMMKDEPLGRDSHRAQSLSRIQPVGWITLAADWSKVTYLGVQ